MGKCCSKNRRKAAINPPVISTWLLLGSRMMTIIEIAFVGLAIIALAWMWRDHKRTERKIDPRDLYW